MRFEIKVTTRETRETRTFTVDEFIAAARFFYSSGAPYAELEGHLSRMMETLEKFGNHGMSMEYLRGGLEIEVIYYQFDEYDRWMRRTQK